MACKGICPRRALGSLIRKVVTDTLAAKVRGGGAEGSHKAEENQMCAIFGDTGPYLGQGL